MNDGPSQRADLLAVIALAAVGLLFWSWYFLGPAEPSTPFVNFDLFAEFHPRHHFAGATLRGVALPLWDPHQAAGLPFLATWQAGVLYPPNWLYALLPTGVTMGLLGALHLAFAGVASFALARELGSSRIAAGLAGLCFAAGGSTAFLSYHTNAIASAPWLPAALFCAARWGRSGDLRSALLLALCLALQLLAGRDYTFVMTLHAVGLFAGFQLVWLRRDGADRRRLGRHLAGLALAGALACGLAAMQLLPTLALAAQSGRLSAGLEGEFLEVYGPLPPALFLANLVNPAPGPLRREYFGWIPLACALIGLQLRGRDRTAVFASVLALVALLLCFGSQTPLYAAYRLLPLGSVFRLPDRFVYLFSLAIALLAARGLDRVFARAGPTRERLRRLAPRFALVAGAGLGLGAALASGWLRAALERAAAPWGWFTFYGIELAHFAELERSLVYAGASLALLVLVAACASTRARVALALSTLALAAADLAVAQRSRALHPAADATPALVAAPCYERVPELAGELGRHLAFRMYGSFGLKDKDGELFQRFSATHYDPLVSARHAAFFGAVQEGGTPILLHPWPERSRSMGFLDRIPSPERFALFDLMGAAVLLVDGRTWARPAALEALLAPLEYVGPCALQRSEVSARLDPATLDLYRNPRAFPRAFVVHDWSTAPDAEAAVRALVAPGFDARREAVVEGLVAPASGGAGRAGEASIVAYAPDRVVVRARSEGPGLLVLTDSWDPDWSATRDGESVRIHPTDALFRGVPLPGGESEVVFRYRPRSVYAGAAISAAALCAFALAWRRAAHQRSLRRSTR